jgi:hypothetical protein
MPFTLHSTVVRTFVPMLQTLAGLLDAGAAYARAKNFDVAVMMNWRLAPDMYPLYRHAQLACDHASHQSARLARCKTVRFDDSTQSLDDLKDRIAKCIAFVESLPAAAFAGIEDETITVSYANGKDVVMPGDAFLQEMTLPNFYFHVTVVYSILRLIGVPLEKGDFLLSVQGYVRDRASVDQRP